MEELTALQYLAQMINQDESLKQGYSAPTRWLTLRDDLKEKYLNQATKMVEQWRSDELSAKDRRDAIKIEVKYYDEN